MLLLLTVLLAAAHVLRPVAGMGLLVVKQAPDAKLLGGRSVPACPVAGARGFMSENAVEPVAVLGANRGIYGVELKEVA